MSFLRARAKSFGYAFAGFRTLVVTQPNARIHLAATGLVTIFGFAVGLSTVDWALILLAVGMVWAGEALNTAIEFLADEVSLERRPRIQFAKDVAAFGVLASALAALGIGLLVFVPHLVRCFAKCPA
jgi:diacylglycerol kinase (ATP)